MRLTLNLEPQNYALARSLAKAEDCSISTAVNQLLRKALEPRMQKSKSVQKNGLLVSRGKVTITPEMVRQMEDEFA